MTSIDREELETLLPHREPILLLDRAEGFEAGRALTGIKHLGADSPHFAGHFPGQPVMPGVLLLEAMAQTGAALVAKTEGLDPAIERLMFASVESARFRKPVLPGATLNFHVELLGERRSFYRFQGRARMDGDRVAESVFSAKLVRMEGPE